MHNAQLKMDKILKISFTEAVIHPWPNYSQLSGGKLKVERGITTRIAKIKRTVKIMPYQEFGATETPKYCKQEYTFLQLL